MADRDPSGARSAVEDAVRGHVDAGRTRAGAEAALAAYGAELLGYLYAVLRSEQDAHDVFADVCVQVWRDLPAFRWQSSLRTWAYAIARHRVLDHREAAARQKRLVPISTSPEMQALVAEARTATRSYQRTDMKDRVAAVRATLDPDDQTLLILRVDRAMEWRDVALVLGISPATARKRYERVKQRLRVLLDR